MGMTGSCSLQASEESVDGPGVRPNIFSNLQPRDGGIYRQLMFLIGSMMGILCGSPACPQFPNYRPDHQMCICVSKKFKQGCPSQDSFPNPASSVDLG